MKPDRHEKARRLRALAHATGAAHDALMFGPDWRPEDRDALIRRLGRMTEQLRRIAMEHECGIRSREGQPR